MVDPVGRCEPGGSLWCGESSPVPAGGGGLGCRQESAVRHFREVHLRSFPLAPRGVRRDSSLASAAAKNGGQIEFRPVTHAHGFVRVFGRAVGRLFRRPRLRHHPRHARRHAPLPRRAALRHVLRFRDGSFTFGDLTLLGGKSASGRRSVRHEAHAHDVRVRRAQYRAAGPKAQCSTSSRPAPGS